ncbi:MAG: cytochrome c biogenesis protein CcdA [Patescibacteria group bacterium]
MTLLAISFVAGALTVLAPCILPLLPVILGTSAAGRSRATPYVVVGSLALSIIFFTYLLKATTALIMVPPEFWTYLSGGILLLFGLTLLFPGLWENLPGLARLSSGSNKLLGEGYQKKTLWGDALVGAALGPIFSTCSPTYFVILASVLPASFFLGSVYLLAYVLGLSLVLLLIAKLGEHFAGKLADISNPRSSFKRGLGILFLLLGILIATGYEKKLETKILDSGYFDITKIENKLLEGIK